jgi:hypothetical protein
VLTTLEARLGIEPRLSALQADAFPLGYRALAGAVGIGPTVLETAALPLRHAPVLLGLSIVKEQQKSPLFRAGCFGIRLFSGFYPPPPRPGFVARMVLSTTCPWAHTNMRHGLPCRSRIVSGLRNLDILNSGADGWILTSDLLLTGQAP